MTRIIGIQARLDSSRLPGKVLMDLGGKPMLEHVVDACQEAALRVWVLTTNRKEDEPIVDFCREREIHCLPSSSNVTNVLGRYIELIHRLPARVSSSPPLYMRVCADAPLIRPGWLRAMFGLAENVHAPVWCEDLCHVGNEAAWMECWADGKPRLDSDKEHAGHGWFSEVGVKVQRLVPRTYFSVNTPADYERAKRLFEESARIEKAVEKIP